MNQFLKQRYRILALLGEGGTSEVYLAWDEKRSAKVAIKLLLEQNSAASLTAFQNEAKALTLLQHPNIVKLYGMEQDADHLFIVMDYIEGKSLSEEIRAARPQGLPLRRLAEIIQPVCSALNYAHRIGLVHCDIKPGNILMREQGELLLADFGIARFKGENSSMLQGAGTLAYMSPEQVRGLPLTPEMDIYALGVVLFEMATGRKPFTGQQSPEWGDDRERLRWEQLNLAPPSPRAFRPDLPVEVELVILKCLAKEPGRRYSSALHLAQALEQALNAALPPTRPVGSQELVETRAFPARQDFQPGPAAVRVPPAESRNQPLVGEPRPLQPGRPRTNTTAYTFLVGLGVVVVVVLAAFMMINPSQGSLPGSTPFPTTDPAKSTTVSIPSGYDYSGKCATFIILDKNDAQVEECVTRIEVQADQKMKVYFRWTVRSVTSGGIEIGSDEGNKNMFLMDNLNRRLDQLQAGGQAREILTIGNGQSKTGWFLFPAPAAGARSFSFHDDDNNNIITGIDRRW